jgi:hypothetical protein
MRPPPRRIGLIACAACRRLLSSGLCVAPRKRNNLTVGSGIGPDLLTLRVAAQALAGSCPRSFGTPTAGGEFHPALKTLYGNRLTGCRAA